MKSIDKNEIDPEIKEAIRHNSLVCFIGSGLSKNIGLPNWIQMVQFFVSELSAHNPGLEAIKQKAHERDADPMTILKLLSAEGYADRCRQLLVPLIDIDLSTANLQNQKKVWKITEKIVTTNYDCALEHAMSPELKEDIEVKLPSDPFLSHGLDLNDILLLFKIHGSIKKPDTCLLFQEDYDPLYKHNHEFLKALKLLSSGATLVFIGYSVRDKEIQYILKNMHALFPAMTNHFIVTAYPNDYQNFGVKTVPLEGEADLTLFLDRLVAYKEKIQTALEEINRTVDLDYAAKQGLLFSFEKQAEKDRRRDAYLAELDKEDIFALESVSEDREERSLINLVKDGKEKELKEYLILRRQAHKIKHIADKRQLEGDQWLGSYEAALETLLDAANIAEDLFKPPSEELAMSYIEIGNVLLHLQNSFEARKWYTNALGLVPDDSRVAAMAYHNLGNIETENGDFEQAYRFYSSAHQIHHTEGTLTLTYMRSLATVLLRLKRFGEAVDLLKRIVVMDEVSDLRKASDYQALGLAQKRMNEFVASARSYETAVEFFFKFYGENRKEFLVFYNDIAYCYTQAEDYNKGVLYYQKALQLEKDPENLFITTNNLAEAYYKMGNYVKALETFKSNLLFLQKNQTPQEYPEAYDYLNQWIDNSKTKARDTLA
jgi:tetratricopeptide (TPR) repeat protein